MSVSAQKKTCLEQSTASGDKVWEEMLDARKTRMLEVTWKQRQKITGLPGSPDREEPLIMIPE